MFDYPLTIPRDTLYRELGVRPEATDSEIRAAERELTSAITEEKSTVDRELEQVYAAVPGLRDAYQRVERAWQHQDHPEEAQQAQRDLARLERKAEQANPSFSQLRKRSADLGQRIAEANRMSLTNPKTRRSYDLAHPPLALLKLADCTRDSFTQNRLAIFLVRREISQFLAARGESVLHPSDLTRDDFTADFTHNPLLDGDAP